MYKVKSRDPVSGKVSSTYNPMKSFFEETNVICLDIEVRREVALYLTYWLSKAIFRGGDSTHIRSHCIYLACQMAFGIQLALVPTLYSYICTELQAATLLVRLGVPLNMVFSTLISYSWYI